MEATGRVQRHAKRGAGSPGLLFNNLPPQEGGRWAAPPKKIGPNFPSGLRLIKQFSVAPISLDEKLFLKNSAPLGAGSMDPPPPPDHPPLLKGALGVPPPLFKRNCLTCLTVECITSGLHLSVF